MSELVEDEVNLEKYHKQKKYPVKRKQGQQRSKSRDKKHRYRSRSAEKGEVKSNSRDNRLDKNGKKVIIKNLKAKNRISDILQDISCRAGKIKHAFLSSDRIPSLNQNVQNYLDMKVIINLQLQIINKVDISIEFVDPSSANKCIKTYNGAELDNLKLECYKV